MSSSPMRTRKQSGESSSTLVLGCKLVVFSSGVAEHKHEWKQATPCSYILISNEHPTPLDRSIAAQQSGSAVVASDR